MSLWLWILINAGISRFKKYNERRAECEKAVEELNQVLDINTLGELDLQTFDEYSYLIKDDNRLKRARHAVWENQRTLQAKEALTAGQLENLVAWLMPHTSHLNMTTK